MRRSSSRITAASTLPSRSALISAGTASAPALTSRLVQERQVTLREVVELHPGAALLARELGDGAEVATRKVLLHVEELLLLVVAGLAQVRREERAHLRR